MGHDVANNSRFLRACAHSNGNFRLVGIPPGEIKFKNVLPFLLDQKNFTGAILGGRKVNQLMLDFAARHNIRAQIEEYPLAC